MSEALRRALDEAQVGEGELAKRLGVDPKTVRRWVAGRMPYPRHRRSIAALLDVDEAKLWPRAMAINPPRSEPAGSEIIATYPHRWAVPRAAWQCLFESAHNAIGVLVYSGLFLAEDTGMVRLIADRARAGVAVRIMLGDPDSPRVSERGEDEGVGDSLAAKIRNSLVLYRSLRDLDAVEIRLHDTVLYNSIYRADEDLLINPHAYGVSASQAPVLHLRRAADGGMASTYLDSFERIWSSAKPLPRE